MKNYIRFVVPALFMLIFSCKQQSQDYFFDQPLTEQEKQAQRLTPEILWKFGRITEAELSPDGKEIAFIVKRYDLKRNKGNAEIFVISTSGGEPEQLTFTVESESSIHWTPDGKRIGYLALAANGTSQIWEIDRHSKKVKQISRVEGDIEIFAYSPAGTHVYYTMRVKTDSSAQDRNPDLPLSTGRVYTDLMYRHWDSWWDYRNSHLFVATYNGNALTTTKDINAGEPYNTPLAPFYEPSEISWSADGKKIAYTSRKLKGKAEALSTNSDIYLYDLETQQTTNLSEGMTGYDRNPVFSPNGKMICWTSMATPGYESDKDRLMLYNFETQTYTDLTKDFDQSVSQLVWSDDSRYIYFISGIHATYQVYRIDVQTQQITQLTNGWHDYTWLARKGDIMV